MSVPYTHTGRPYVDANNPFVSAELTGPDQYGVPGFILWGPDGQAVATFRMEDRHRTLMREGRDLVAARVVDKLNGHE